MNGLSRGEESMTICSAVLIQYHYQRVTDGQTDGRTDVQLPVYLLRASAYLTHVKTENDYKKMGGSGNGKMVKKTTRVVLVYHSSTSGSHIVASSQ